MQLFFRKCFELQCDSRFKQSAHLKKKTSQELRMLSRSLSDCKSLLLNVMIQVSQFVSNIQLCHYVTKALNDSYSKFLNHCLSSLCSYCSCQSKTAFWLCYVATGNKCYIFLKRIHQEPFLSGVLLRQLFSIIVDNKSFMRSTGKQFYNGFMFFAFK